MRRLPLRLPQVPLISEGGPEFAKCIESRVLINVQKYDCYGDYKRDIVVDEIEQLSRFALTDLTVCKTDE